MVLCRFVLFVFLFLITTSVYALEENPHNPWKTSFRFGNGQFKNPEFSSTSTSLLCPDLEFLTFWTSQNAFNIGTDLYFNYSDGSVSLFGVKLGYRHYYWGVGYPEIVHTEYIQGEGLTKYAGYYGIELKRYTYFLGSNVLEENDFEQNGTFYNFNILTGIDYKLSRSLELNGEISYTLMPLASSDDRIKLSAIILYFGIAFLW